VHCSVEREPKNHLIPPDSKQPHAHGDLLIYRGSRAYYIDVSIVHSAAPSLLQNTTPSSAIQTQALHATQAREKAKTTKYEELCRLNRYTFIPFVLESFGGFGAAALEFVKLLSKDWDNTHTDMQCSTAVFHTYALRCISLALQRGNALISAHGLHSCVVSSRLGASVLPPGSLYHHFPMPTTALQLMRQDATMGRIINNSIEEREEEMQHFVQNGVPLSPDGEPPQQSSSSLSLPSSSLPSRAHVYIHAHDQNNTTNSYPPLPHSVPDVVTVPPVLPVVVLSSPAAAHPTAAALLTYTEVLNRTTATDPDAMEISNSQG
jgi:hypothetical protein